MKIEDERRRAILEESIRELRGFTGPDTEATGTPSATEGLRDKSPPKTRSDDAAPN